MIRVATLNLLQNPLLIQERVSALVAELLPAKVDFLLLQEVLPPEDGFDIVSHLAGALGLPHTAYDKCDDRISGTAVLSRHPFQAIPVPDGWVGTRPIIAQSEVDGRRVVAISHHGEWGSRAVETRMSQLALLSDVAHDLFTCDGANLDRRTRPIVILGGDLNAEPGSGPLRFIRGEDAWHGKSALWVDAGEHVGETGHTTGGPMELCVATATGRAGAPYRPERTPLRRIDYVLVYEWAYGQAGEPVAARRFATDTFPTSDGRAFTVSDHYGVVADLWTPEG